MAKDYRMKSSAFAEAGTQHVNQPLGKAGVAARVIHVAVLYAWALVGVWWWCVERDVNKRLRGLKAVMHSYSNSAQHAEKRPPAKGPRPQHCSTGVGRSVTLAGHREEAYYPAFQVQVLSHPVQDGLRDRWHFTSAPGHRGIS